MKMKKILLLFLPLVSLILELLPYGVVLNFANPDGEPWRKTFSYFDLINVGYANFAPFITAVLTCILIGLLIINCFIISKKISIAIKCISGIDVIISALPIFNGIEYVSAIGVCITLLLALIFGLNLSFKEN